MRRRVSSSSTVRLARNVKNELSHSQPPSMIVLTPVKCALWVHDATFSQEDVLISPAVKKELGIEEGDLAEIHLHTESTAVHDFKPDSPSDSEHDDESVSDLNLEDALKSEGTRCLCIVKVASTELMEKQKGLEISMARPLADAFGFRSRTQVTIASADLDTCTASHVELGFRDAYLARSDMWRIASRELAGRTVYKGQKISFLGGMKVTVKTIHVHGRHVTTGLFSRSTVPVFRSEAARYVLFVQMSREMWDFDSEGNGEIMFNRVVNGFLPDLFRRWAALEVRHLVSIILFGRLEYDRHDFGTFFGATGEPSQSSSASNPSMRTHQDFYRVVVTDMASAQWTTILDELKKDFRVFLRDMSLLAPKLAQPGNTVEENKLPKITGKPSTAMKGNILEAINMASFQFSNDFIDRDLIRTGVSIIVITAGTGVFEVDRDLLNLTSENLTDNGIAIDIVCLSKMPLHSVPLFKYQLPLSGSRSRVSSCVSASPHVVASGISHPSLPNLGHSPAYSSYTGTSATYFSRFPSAFPTKLPQSHGFGIPQWIDLSYWSPATNGAVYEPHLRQRRLSRELYSYASRSFVPRVRMYELQMMGLMELGMADITIPYLNETNVLRLRKRQSIHAGSNYFPSATSSSPIHLRKIQSAATTYHDNQPAKSFSIKPSDNHPTNIDEHDASVFRDVAVPSEAKPKKLKSKKQSKSLSETDQKSRSRKIALDIPLPQVSRKSSSTFVLPLLDKKSAMADDKSASKTLPKPTQTPRISRSISYALRGLLPSSQSATSGVIKTDVIKAQPSLATTSMTQATAATLRHTTRAESILSSEGEVSSVLHADADTRSTISREKVTEQASKPILINAIGQQAHGGKKSQPLRKPAKKEKQEYMWSDKPHHTSTQTSARNSRASSLSGPISEPLSLDMMPDSIPKSNLSFIRNVNASNPLKKHPDAAAVFGKWQHLYPHKPRSSTVKWRSLCTPASVPLTTESFPSLKNIDEDYEKQEHTVVMKSSIDIDEGQLTMSTLLREMIALRLAHGYQVITGPGIKQISGTGLCDINALFDPDRITEYGHHIFLCMGNTVQKLTFKSQASIRVVRYVRKIPESDQSTPQTIHYIPNIRTILSDQYHPRPIDLRGVSELYPWEAADHYLASGGSGEEGKVENLRFWRVRFVLLPVEPPSNVYRPQQQQGDDNEEEIHLMGIRALTQMWQKARYITASERKVAQNRMNALRRKDLNPLEIKFETLNPSEVVATELDKLLTLEESGEVQSTQLLPDSEKLDRETPMAKLAQAMQSEKGIEIKNRRWHLRLHYNCFNGEEFTNWLLHNVKHTETREEAVAFGNQLMKEGLFEHVNGRHDFKDGHYFYSLKAEHRLPKLDIKAAWYAPGRRSDKSIPPTPLSENPNRELPPNLTTRSRSGSSLAFQLTPNVAAGDSKLPSDQKKRTVSLSKMIKIDVDPRRRSSKPEVVNLHYDRLHNPENCYHIELSWLTATSKLIDDAIVSWTTQAEKYGLKLVEVPIAEAGEIPKREPFRSVYRVRLALQPPKRIIFNNVFTNNSFTPQPNSMPDDHTYQKAILKRFNFVLDLEATSEYPENVDIQYSWGRLEYRHTQFVHRSGIVLAQITDDGDLILLANRLYNARFTSGRDVGGKFIPGSAKHLSHMSTTVPALPPMQASGIMGVNVQSPSLHPSSPATRATADVLGIRGLSSDSPSRYITPEQIGDDIEAFCSDAQKLELFYREVSTTPTLASMATTTSDRRRTGGSSTGSNLLRPVRDQHIAGLAPGDAGIIPPMELPESVASSTGVAGGLFMTSIGSSSANTGLGFSMLRRARGSTMYDSVAEIFGRDKDKENAATGGQDRSSRSGSTSEEPSGSLRAQKRNSRDIDGTGTIHGHGHGHGNSNGNGEEGIRTGSPLVNPVTLGSPSISVLKSPRGRSTMS